MHSPPQQWEIVVGLVVLVLGLIAILARGKRGKLPYFSRKTLLTQGEAAFYSVLIQAIPPGTNLAPKVRVADILDCSGENRQSHFNRISRKHVDFVLINARTTEFLLIIELDDKTHQRRDRQERDEFLDRAFQAAGLNVLHVKAARNYNLGELRAALARS
jgi:hypothetical protein